eukprot:10065859-Alexandrium_andersonii.AAC.2
MVPEPANAGDGLINGVVAQASLAQHRMRQDRARIAVFDHQRRQSSVAGVLGEEATVHRNLRDIIAGTTTGTAHAYTRVASARRRRAQPDPKPPVAPDSRHWGAPTRRQQTPA